MVTSGIRIGTPALTTRGMKEAEMKPMGRFISTVLKDLKNESTIGKVREEVERALRAIPAVCGTDREGIKGRDRDRSEARFFHPRPEPYTRYPAKPQQVKDRQRSQESARHQAGHRPSQLGRVLHGHREPRCAPLHVPAARRRGRPGQGQAHSHHGLQRGPERAPPLPGGRLPPGADERPLRRAPRALPGASRRAERDHPGRRFTG